MTHLPRDGGSSACGASLHGSQAGREPSLLDECRLREQRQDQASHALLVLCVAEQRQHVIEATLLEIGQLADTLLWRADDRLSRKHRTTGGALAIGLPLDRVPVRRASASASWGVSPTRIGMLFPTVIGRVGQSGVDIPSSTRSRPARASTQPSASSVTFASVASESPPIQIGGCGLWYGTGLKGRSRTRT